MYYWIILERKGGTEIYHHEENLLPGFLPERILPWMKAQFADEEFNLCENCDLDTRCHPIDKDGSKWCTVLLHDALKPTWKIKDIA